MVHEHGPNLWSPVVPVQPQEITVVRSEHVRSAIKITVRLCWISCDAVTQHKPPIRNLVVDPERGVGFGLPRATKFNRTWDGDCRKNRQLHLHPVLILDGVKGLADEFTEP